jgi:ferritin-like metal-binding protein YciE
MATSTIDDQLNAYLSDAYSIEEQALAQMRAAPDIAGDPELAAAFARHLGETERQLQLVRERLEARGAEASRLKRLVMEIGGKGFVLFARSQPDTPGKLTAHAYSYEALEQASYDLLERVARRAGDEETAKAARAIGAQEREMAERLEALFDRAAAASIVGKSGDDLRDSLTDYLADAHALEQQSIGLLELGAKFAGDPELERLFDQHLGETRVQIQRVEGRLEALGSSPSRLKDAAMRIGAFNWGGFFQAHPDTPGKLAAFSYAFEHLEIAGYELLHRVAAHAGDDDTAAMARGIAGEERAAAARIRASFDRAVEAALDAQGVKA